MAPWPGETLYCHCYSLSYHSCINIETWQENKVNTHLYFVIISLFLKFSSKAIVYLKIKQQLKLFCFIYGHNVQIPNLHSSIQCSVFICIHNTSNKSAGIWLARGQYKNSHIPLKNFPVGRPNRGRIYDQSLIGQTQLHCKLHLVLYLKNIIDSKILFFIYS